MLRVADHALRTDPGRRRPDNEDSVFVRVPLFVLADGMGGAQAGEIASRTAVEAFAGGLPEGDGSPEQRLSGLVAEANARIHELAQSDEQRAGMGTTLTAAYVGEHDVAVAHVGDSRLYRLRKGQLEQLTDDHSLVGELVRRGQISAEEAEEHPQRSIITRALGIEGEVVVDHHTWPARDGDVFLLCSDGLTSMVPDAGVAEIIAAEPSLTDACAALVRAANDAGGRDNISVVLFRVEEVTPGAGGAVPATERGAVEEQHTMAGAAAPTTEEVRRATAVADRERQAEPRSAVPRAPRPPRAAPAAEKPRNQALTTGLKALTVLLVFVALLGSGAWIASRAVYFVGTDDRGFVTLYQGLPYELPFLKLYGTEFVSGLPAQTLSARARRTVTDHKLRTHDDAVDLVRQLEQGRLAGQ